KVWSNFLKYIKKDWSTKHYVGEDHAGHRYYELVNTRQNVTRGFDPPPSRPDSQPGVEWQSWLKGTRRFPPSDQELALNQMRGKAQLAQNTVTEKRAPRIDTKDPPPDKDKPAPFPKYDDMESAPGVKKGD
ncbi:unnamed protein product, partial [Cylicostephanus goldi]